MKTERIFIFSYKNQELERVDWDIEQSDIEIIKSCLAYTKGINFEDIDMEEVKEFKPELTEKMFVRYDGSLMFLRTPNSNPIVVKNPTASVDINHEELLEEFLGMIAKKDFDNAITFV